MKFLVAQHLYKLGECSDLSNRKWPYGVSYFTSLLTWKSPVFILYLLLSVPALPPVMRLIPIKFLPPARGLRYLCHVIFHSCSRCDLQHLMVPDRWSVFLQSTRDRNNRINQNRQVNREHIWLCVAYMDTTSWWAMIVRTRFSRFSSLTKQVGSRTCTLAKPLLSMCFGEIVLTLSWADLTAHFPLGVCLKAKGLIQYVKSHRP